MGTWLWWLEPLVAGVDLESKEVCSYDGVVEGWWWGRAVAGVGWHWWGTAEEVAVWPLLGDASEKIFGPAPWLVDGSVGLLEEERRPGLLLWHLV
jgi:hypothetical protein